MRAVRLGVEGLGRWVAQERAKSDSPPPALDVDERAELARLRTENAELRMDREGPARAAYAVSVGGNARTWARPTPGPARR